MDGDLQWHLTGKRMGGAPKTWIVRAKRHFHHVEQAFSYVAIFDETLRRFLGGHLNRRVVVSGAYDEIRFGHDPPFIGPVMMRESPARRFDNAHTLRRNLSRLWLNNLSFFLSGWC